MRLTAEAAAGREKRMTKRQGRIVRELAMRKQRKEYQGMLTKSAAFAIGGHTKAIASQFTFKQDHADNKHTRAIVHHWGAGGGGSHYHMAGTKQFHKGVRVKGVVMRHSRQGAKLAASRQNARSAKKSGGMSVLK